MQTFMSNFEKTLLDVRMKQQLNYFNKLPAI